MAGSVLGIHQPNFLPWPGYFIKLACSDHFIFLDDVVIDYYGYARRCKVSGQKTAEWLSLPLLENERKLIFNNYHIDINKITERVLNKIKLQYGQHDFFSEIFPLIENALKNNETKLATFNTAIIQNLASALGIRNNFMFSSAFNISASGSEKIIGLARALHSTIYISGASGEKYLDKSAFAREHIQLLIFNMQDELNAYLQKNNLNAASGLSLIDWLFTFGLGATSGHIHAIAQQITAKFPAGIL